MSEAHTGQVVLERTFREAYDWLAEHGPANLKTEKRGTSFQAIADVGKRGAHAGERVIRFTSKGGEARAYGCCWRWYTDCSGTRIGMYCQALDSAVNRVRANKPSMPPADLGRSTPGGSTDGATADTDRPAPEQFSMNSEQAFETLLAAVSAALNESLARNSQAALRGDVEALQTESDLLDKLVRARNQLQDLRDIWPLQVEGQPAASQSQLPEPGLSGQRTPQTAFYLPILQVLAEMGGRGAASDVLDTVGEIMADQLTDYDCARLESGQIRWRNTAHSARYAMKQRGLIADNSPIGTWEITPQGHAYLADQCA